MKKNKNTKFTNNVPDLIIALVCILGIVAGISFFIKDMNISLKADSEPIGVIYFKKNTAQRRLINKNLWEKLKVQAPVYNGDRIRTGNYSEANIVFNDGSEIALYDNSLVQIFSEDGNTINFVNGSISIVSSDNAKETGETISVVAGNKVMSLGKNTSAVFSSPISLSQNKGDTVVAVSAGEVYVKPAENSKKKQKSSNTAAYETVSAGSVAQYQTELKSVELLELPAKTTSTATETKKTAVSYAADKQFKVLSPAPTYSVIQNKDEIKFVPFFWTEVKDIKIEFSYSSVFSSIVNTEYLSSDTHKGSVALDFANNGDLIYWRAEPVNSEDYKNVVSGKIEVRSEEKKQQELKTAVTQVFGNQAAEEISAQVEQKTKTVTSSEAVAMTDIIPARKPVTRKNASVTTPTATKTEKPGETVTSASEQTVSTPVTIDSFVQTQKAKKEQEKIEAEKIEAEKLAEAEQKTEVEVPVVAEKPKTEVAKKPAVTTTKPKTSTKPAVKKPVTTKPSVTATKTPETAALVNQPMPVPELSVVPAGVATVAKQDSGILPTEAIPPAPLITETEKEEIAKGTEENVQIEAAEEIYEPEVINPVEKVNESAVPSEVIKDNVPVVTEETKPAEVKPVKTKPAETKPAETSPVVETKPVEVPVESVPKVTEETKPVETKPVEVKPVEVKPAETPVVVAPVTENTTPVVSKGTEENVVIPTETVPVTPESTVTEPVRGPQNTFTSVVPLLLTPAASKIYTEADFADSDEPSIVFSWNPVENAQAYKFEIVNEDGRTVWSTTCRTNRFVLSDNIDVISEDGEYNWKVTAISKTDGVVYNSLTASRTFYISFEDVDAVEGVSKTNLITFD